ncbi:hypothetical protein DL89DRAFT_231449 [Linderina pennispora]|uniref:Ketosynthase family 3 (KS3) domain-containing protein n=1 Tax=Linderina pennispora TaxID=61395 RepID=A0A1Y1WKH7_9FUNG|nr:uncharacterized protein DL89DRAFT_231449 [Linderina pennispora]ORX73828.1 hypothetical protein DL89DRAFT_231449 [Linderina pennispora]
MNLFTCKVVLASGGVSTNIPIPGDNFPVAKELAASFLDGGPPAVSTEIELVALFLAYCSSRSPDVAVAVFLHFHQEFCADENIHVVVQQLNLSAEQARTVLKGYYSVWNTLEARQLLPEVPVPAIFSDANIRLAAMFGSPGGADSYVDEAAWLLDVYGPLLSDFVTHMSDFLKRESADPLLAKAHSRPLDIAGWLASPDAMPDAKYLLTAPVITPMLGLIQAMHVAVLYKTLNMSPGDLVSRFKVAIGHSQGLTMAAAFASVTVEASFYVATEKVLGILLATSAIVQQNFSSNPSHAGAPGFLLRTDGLPVPMVSVRGLAQETLESFIAAFNGDCMDEDSEVSLALINGRSTFVVAGKTDAVTYFARHLRKHTVPPTEDQSRVRFSQRKPVADISPLSMSVPTHCKLQLDIAPIVYEFVTAKGWILNPDTLRTQVNAVVDGHDLRDEVDLTRFLIDSMCVYRVDWPTAVNSADATFIVDFSPGTFSTFGKLARDILDGYGKTIISTSSPTPCTESRMGSKADLFKLNISDVFTVPSWESAFSPCLVRAAHDGLLHICTRMSLALGLPPVMVAGMTPTTSNEHFVAAISNAGYHVEFGGGGIYTEKVFRERVDNLVQFLEPGNGFAVNTVYMDRKQWVFQYPSILRMRREGVPITGLCIGGGVPSVDVANSIIEELRDAGIRHVAFKPGSVATILQAIAIARANPDFPIIIQWTGGRAGGHHSCEDFHEPMLETYSKIRSLPNTILVVGSGFGDTDGILPYLSGQWSVQFGYAPMPVDGVLLASCVLTAKESAISLEAKELIAAATGVEDSEWELSYTGNAGGVISAMSGYGEIAHCVANRAALALRELNDMIFTKPYAEQLPIIMANKDRIIKWLNEDYTRPWFGMKSDGRVVDLEEMTYLEVLNRLVEFMYVADKSRWLDVSYVRLFGEFISRAEDRVSKIESRRVFQRFVQLQDPHVIINLAIKAFPDIGHTLLALEDVQYLVWLCKRSGTKPVPFVPILDADLHVWMTKDINSQAEDLDTVVDRDVQRTVIALGPVSAKYATTVNEPVKDILDRVYTGLTEKLSMCNFDKDASLVRPCEYLAPEPFPVSLPTSVAVAVDESSRTYKLPTDAALLPDPDVWLEALAGPTQSWLRALLTSPVVVRKSLYAANPIRQVLRPMAGQTAEASFDANKPVKLDIHGPTGVLDIRIQLHGEKNILMIIYHRIGEEQFEIQFPYIYTPSKSAVLIAEDTHGRDIAYCRSILSMHGITSDPGYIVCDDIEQHFTDAVLKPFTVTEDFVRKYCSSVHNASEYYKRAASGSSMAPIDIFFSITIKQLTSILTGLPLNQGMMGILHLYHNTEYESGVSPLHVGDTIYYQMVLTALENVDPGLRMTFTSRFYRDGLLIAASEDMIVSPNQYVAYKQAFRLTDEPVRHMLILSDEKATVLEAKEWFTYKDTLEPVKAAPGEVLEFRLQSCYRFKSKGLISHIKTYGPVYRLKPYGELEHIADVYFETTDVYGNQVVDYLNQNQHVASDSVRFEHGGVPIRYAGNVDAMSIKAPSENWEFAHASGDQNMLHTNPYVVAYIGESEVICHGMWTSAATRAVVESIVADNDPRRMRSYEVNFIGKVYPSNDLQVELVHTGMASGYMVINGKTVNQNRETVMALTAEVAQAKTAYVFTGQGSQFVGMGMDLYVSSTAARDVWDRADKHMLNKYGVSLLKIVQENPREYLVKFGGKKGNQIRAQYLSLVREFDSDIVQLIPGITQTSTSYTHRYANGLLNATLFTQPIQTVMSLAQAADMRAHGLIQDDAIFAGHSLGEIGSLAAIAEIVSVEDAVDIALYRGLLLHMSVDRDINGCSEYAMVSVSPQRAGKLFGISNLLRLVDLICERKQQLLEVINYNVRGQQYIVTGHIESLTAMCRIIDRLSAESITLAEIEEGEEITKTIDGILNEHPHTRVLQTGNATIAIPGIDAPSHSSQLAASISTFRRVLDSRIPHIKRLTSLLCGRYIPNLTGEPFEITKEYFDRVYSITHSPVIEDILQYRETDGTDTLGNQVYLARTLLIELLSFQLSSPVKWIETQDSMFKSCSVKRLVEIGPRPILCRMATQTLGSNSWLCEEVAILHASKDRDDVYYTASQTEYADINTDPLSLRSGQSTSSKPTKQEGAPKPPGPAVEEQAALHPVLPAATCSVDDVPIPIIDILRATISWKLSTAIAKVYPTMSIKELVAGKSMVQNELFGDFQKEFGKGLPEHAEEQTLEELAKVLGNSTNSLGKHSQSLINRIFVEKLPNGFTQSVARSYLKDNYGLGPRRQDALLLMSVTMEPSCRLADEEAAQVWLESAAQMYASHVGLSLTATAQNGNRNGAMAASAVINSAEFDKAQKNQRNLILDQIETLTKHVGLDTRQGTRSAEKLQLEVAVLKSENDKVKREFGSGLIDKTNTLFDANKARHFDSYWNWARQDVLEWISGILSGEDSSMDRATYMKRVHMLKNRSNPGLLSMLQAFIGTLKADLCPFASRALKQTEIIYAACRESENVSPVYKELSTPLRPHTEITFRGDIDSCELPREGEQSIGDYIQHMKCASKDGLPLLYMYGRQAGNAWSYSKEISDEYFSSMEDAAVNGISFEGKCALVTGCGKGSIGSGLVEGLLSGGAKVVATTSNYSLASIRSFEEMYRKFGSRGSELVLVPFNQASSCDVEALIQYIYGKDGLGWDLDYIAPFAAFPEHGKDAGSVDSYSELTLRTLLTNLFRMIGQVKAAKVRTGNTLHPSLLVLPHSSNHGIAGNDGMYGETKAALHTLYNRWHTESWSEYISITGGEIGWTRSTKLTSGSANVYAAMEEMGMRTFSREEMSFNILCLLSQGMEETAHDNPVFGNFNGGSYSIETVGKELSKRRSMLIETARLRKAAHSDVCAVYFTEQKEDSVTLSFVNKTIPRAQHRVDSPAVKEYEQLDHLRYLEGMVDLDKVVVVTGFGEVGPFGNAALRWEQEAYGMFSMEGCIELAWMMGLIKRFSGDHPGTGSHYTGWVDAKTQEPVHDMEMRAKYEPYILEHTGIRLVEPEIWGEKDVDMKSFIRELQIDQDMPPFETSAEEALHFKQRNGDKVDTWENPDGTWSVRLLKGTVIHVPKAIDIGHTVLSQTPTGWDPVRLGIPEDLALNMDDANHYTLIATMEALVRSGITDPYELYQYFHVSKVGHAIGSSAGGAKTLVNVFRNRYLDKNVNSDMMTECTVNHMSAWLNMLLFSASGPLKPTVGACATSAIALDLAAESIIQGKADVMIAGAGEGFTNDTSFEFGLMNATASARDELVKGRIPQEMSRPCTSTRSGFVESHGSGVAVLMSATAALKIGAPIYGILAMSATATDKSTRNYSAPGQGILSIGKENPTLSDLQLLDIHYRRQMRDRQLAALEQLGNTGVAKDIRQAVKTTWGNDFYKMCKSTSPLRAALATWGLDADDIGLASFHGTSTKLNDVNESNIVNMLMKHVGRTPGLPVPVVCQKWILGHTKAPATSCSMHGILQSMTTGLIPGNRNADNIDDELEQHEHLVYLSKTIRAPTIKAALFTSFGFSQSNGAGLIVHPDYLFATLSKEELVEYTAKVDERMKRSTRYWQGALLGNHTYFQAKEEPPFSQEQEASVFLDPGARAKLDSKTKQYTF